MARAPLLDRSKIRDRHGRHDPWRTIGMLPAWRVEYNADELEPDELGATLHDERRIVIRPGLSCAARRSVLTHETGHVLRGPVPSRLTEDDEFYVERQAGRLLMPSVLRVTEALMDASEDYKRAAETLRVDPQLLRFRLATLKPSERAWAAAHLRVMPGIVVDPGARLTPANSVATYDPGHACASSGWRRARCR